MIYYLIALAVIGLDRISKWLIVHKLDLYESIPVMGNFFMITSHRNRGAAFGILQNKQWFFLVITVIIVAGIIWYLNKWMRQSDKKLLCTSLSLILGGAVGNFIDRASTGEVVDFLQFHFHFTLFGRVIDYIYPIFNVADSSIFIGVALIFVDSLLSWRKEKENFIQDEAR